MNCRYRALLLTGLFFAPGIVSAHSPIEGIDSFYSGLLHPVFVPTHLLALIALGLFMGQRSMQQNNLALGAFLVASITGLIAAWFSIGNNTEVILVTSSAILGVLVATNLAVAPLWCTILVAIAGLLIGMDSSQETLSGKEKLFTMTGTATGMNIFLLYATGLANYLNRKAWQKIGVRILGSWVAASSLLVLVLSLSRSL